MTTHFTVHTNRWVRGAVSTIFLLAIIWAATQFDKVAYLYQETVVYDISSQFGEGFTYYNENGNPAIGKKVLAAFKKLTGESVIWERGERMWRFREEHDEPGRQQY